MNYINQLSFNEATDEDFNRLAESLSTPNNKVTKEQAKELVRQKDLYKQTRTSAQQQAFESLGGFLREQGTDAEGNKLSGQDLEKLLSKGQGAKLFQRAMEETAAAQGSKFMGMTRAQRRARVLQLARLNTPEALTAGQVEEMTAGGTFAAGETPDERAAAAVDKQFETPEDRAAFLERGAEGTGDIARIKALNENLDRLKNAARAHSELSEEYNIQFEAFLNALKRGGSAMDTVADQLESVADELAEKGYLSTKPTEQ